MYYQGIFYIDGSTENTDLKSRNFRVAELQKICRSINNVVYLHNNIVVMNGIAIVGINGWYGNHTEYTLSDNMAIEQYRRDDLLYLYNTIKKLQIHGDVQKILIISNSVPDRKLYFHEMDGFIDDMSPAIALKTDTEHKVKYWIFGTYNKMVDADIDGINFISNPKGLETTYYAKRLTV
jgi:predicted phosphohydrolase